MRQVSPSPWRAPNSKSLSCRAPLASETMQKEGSRCGESKRPMQNGDSRHPLLATDIIKHVTAEDEPSGDGEHRSSRPAPAGTAPPDGDMDSPEQAEQPERCEGGGPMGNKRPEFDRMRARSERTLAHEEVMKQHPDCAGKPYRKCDAVDRQSPHARQFWSSWRRNVSLAAHMPRRACRTSQSAWRQVTTPIRGSVRMFSTLCKSDGMGGQNPFYAVGDVPA